MKIQMNSGKNIIIRRICYNVQLRFETAQLLKKEINEREFNGYSIIGESVNPGGDDGVISLKIEMIETYEKLFVEFMEEFCKKYLPDEECEITE